MSEKFSATLRVGDLNDFIAPSQSCIVSLKGYEPASKPERASDKSQDKATPNLSQSPSEPVKVTLHDCLACSGCLTSAETVMLEQQSVDEFLSQVKVNKEAVIVSLSPQSRASLAAHFDISPLQVFRKLTQFFKSLGVKAVFDTNCSRDLALIEACDEFITRYNQHLATYAQECVPTLPMLSSACPGWICYAEKTLGSYILPYISTVRSPQQSIGSIIKHHICWKLGLTPDKVYHVSVMPCYDKKLEAFRDDFVFSMGRQGETGHEAAGPRIAEVDSVLTTGEVLDLIKLKSCDFRSLEEAPLDRLLTNVDEEGHLYGVQGGSGGYAETIFRYAAERLFGKDMQGPVNFKILRNSDFREATLEVNGKIVLKFALCYGFRNLQNIVRKIKTGKSDYHYVEVMACPSGCLNGGGQIKPKLGQSAKDTIQLLENLYLQDVRVADPFENPLVKGLYDEWLGLPGSEKAKKYVRTAYHPTVSSMASQLSNW
ncbi:protein NAR1 isoform X1 [Amborella trichopoda]|uniref:Iron hydrogenase small subunit domain-containing protein n=1 Tax=Amborella trichopoda TaxID=13333 RepID=W1NJZ1_AMBTC|nr:protein NAR1 isoform X1 [Amborella trichopoda]ERM95549.1 hypothetical protein AMTR_s00023p00054320 [Amborella trichopoda]|eukprot:XP_006828133.1 protein NAR1 isoform X1 [Amborella trichopoda]